MAKKTDPLAEYYATATPYAAIGDFMKAGVKEFGANSIMFANQQASYTYIDTGIFALDYSFGGGFIEGQPHLVVGYPGAGKSTICLKALGRCLEKYPEDNAAYCDFEGTFDSMWAAANGVDLERLLLFQPTIGEEGTDMMITALQQPSIKMLILDSIPAIVPVGVASVSTFKETMGLRAKLMSKFIQGMIVELSRRRKAGNPCTVILINQWREKVGLSFGDSRYIPGGEQQGYQITSRVELGTAKEIVSKEDSVIEYSEHSFKIPKFKGPKQLREGEFKLIKEVGGELPMGAVDDYKTVMTYAKRAGFLRGGGTSYRIDTIDQKFGNHEAIVKHMIENPLDYIDLKARLIGQYRSYVGMSSLPSDNYLLRFHGEPLQISAQVTEDDDA